MSKVTWQKSNVRPTVVPRSPAGKGCTRAVSDTIPPANPGGRRLIQVMGFHKTYKQTVAVADLSFDVLPGQILGLLGPNGAGKTTTMRAIAGIIPPTRGRLFVDGVDVQL